jgi:hypothetical protein
MLPVGFKPAILAIEPTQTFALDRSVTGIVPEDYRIETPHSIYVLGNTTIFSVYSFCGFN